MNMCCFHPIQPISSYNTNGKSRFFPPPTTRQFQKIWILNLAHLGNFLFIFQKCQKLPKLINKHHSYVNKSSCETYVARKLFINIIILYLGQHDYKLQTRPNGHNDLCRIYRTYGVVTTCVKCLL